MAVFRRRPTSPGPFRHYARYRSHVREDFGECCAYCLLHEVVAGGEESFQLDHFRPKSLPQFASLINDFYNLYYACQVCNKLKRNRWPTSAQETTGYGFVNFCAEPFFRHFREWPDGSWMPLSRPAEYTLDKLRLNRAHLVRIRLYLREIAESRGLPPLDWNVPVGEQIQRLLLDIL